MKKLFLMIIVLLLFSFGASVTSACVCAFNKPSDSFEKTDAVFIGKITKALKSKLKWRVKVSSVIKGDVPETVTFYAAMVNTSCENSNFKLNETYVFFANKIETDEVGYYENGEIAEDEKEKIGNYEPETCSWTTTLNDWKSEENRKRLQGYKDENFLKIIDAEKKPKNAKTQTSNKL